MSDKQVLGVKIETFALRLLLGRLENNSDGIEAVLADINNDDASIGIYWGVAPFLAFIVSKLFAQRHGREEAARRIAALERNTATDCAESTEQITPPVSIANGDMQDLAAEMAAAWRLVRLCLHNDSAGLQAVLDDVERSGRLTGVILGLNGMATGAVLQGCGGSRQAAMHEVAAYLAKVLDNAEHPA